MLHLAAHIRVASQHGTATSVNALKDSGWIKGNTRVRTSMSVTRVAPRVSTYVQTRWGHTFAHVDQATESSMSPIVRTLMNVLKKTTASIGAPTPLVVTHVWRKKKIPGLHLVC